MNLKRKKKKGEGAVLRGASLRKIICFLSIIPPDRFLLKARCIDFPSALRSFLFVSFEKMKQVATASPGGFL